MTALDETLVPPHDLDAERAAVGGMLLSADAIASVTETVTARDFYRPAHATIYDTAVALYGRGEPIDAVSVAADLARQNLLERVGGPGYLHTLIAAVPSAANAGYYARIIAELALLRRVGEAGLRIAQIGHGPGRTGAEAADAAEAALYAAIDARRAPDGPKAPAETLAATLAEVERIAQAGGGITGLPTGIVDLDEALGGLHPGQLVVIAARPALGKSTLALDWARHAAIRNGSPTLFFSLEMSTSEINQRLISAEARVQLQAIRNGRLTDDDWTRIARATPGIIEAPLYVDTSPDLTLMAIRSAARRLRQRHGLALVVVDYLQLLTHASGRRSDNRQVEVAEMSRSLKGLAGELGVPVVALSQLNRASEQRSDKKPQLSDLRESGAIEQDADVVILLFRDDAHDPHSARAGEADLILAKHRNGRTGTITVGFQGYYSRFVDLSGASPSTDRSAA